MKFIRQYRIYIVVLIIHILAIGGPFVWWLFADFFKEKPVPVLTITTIELPPSNEPKGAAGGTPPPPNPEPPNPGPPTPEPPTPTPPTPTPPKPVPPKPVPPKPVPPKIKKPTIKQPEPVPPKQPEKKPDRKILDPKEITISTTSVIKPKTPAKSPQKDLDKKPYSPPSGNGPKTDLAQRLGAIANQPPGNGGGNPDAEGAAATYGQTLAAYIKPRWNQPNQYELNHTKPFVIVKFYISPSGKVMGAQITTPSNVPAMDRSVIKLLNSMQFVPAPPPGLNTIEIRMEIEN